jgi:hypothetical protein
MFESGVGDTWFERFSGFGWFFQFPKLHFSLFFHDFSKPKQFLSSAFPFYVICTPYQLTDCVLVACCSIDPEKSWELKVLTIFVKSRFLNWKIHFLPNL